MPLHRMYLPLKPPCVYLNRLIVDPKYKKFLATILGPERSWWDARGRKIAADRKCRECEKCPGIGEFAALARCGTHGGIAGF